MRIPAFTALALFLGTGNASAWEEYLYLDQGVAIQFPVKPEAMKSTYDSIYARGLPAMVYSAEDDHVVYKLTAVDVSSRPDLGASFVNEAGYDLMRKGDVIFTDSRVSSRTRGRSSGSPSWSIARTAAGRATRSIFTRGGSISPRPWCSPRAETRI